VSDRFEFIDAEHAANTSNTTTTLPVVKMCALLEVSRSGFYEWKTRPASATATRRDELKLLIAESFAGSDGTYGYRRVHADLAAWGVHCGPELVRCLLRELGLQPCQPRPWRFNLTDNDGHTDHLPDLVNRDFTAAAPGQKMVADITYIDTWQGWVYLATVIDCHTKAVIGWAMDDHYRTPLIETAIEMAARNHKLAAGAVFHSDRGSNYTSTQFARTLTKTRPSPIGRENWDLLRQRDGRIVLRRTQERTCPPHPIPHPRPRLPRHCPLHRTPLQFTTSPLSTRLPDPPTSPRRAPGEPTRSVN
jgi:hypothetical protein